MAFTLFEPLFAKIDEVTATFVTDFSSNVISAMTPFVSLGLTLSFITYGILVMRGAVDMPIFDFLKRSIHIGVVCSIALAGGIYQTHLAEIVTTLPDSLAHAFISGNSISNGAASMLDEAAGNGYDVMAEAFDKVGFFGDDSLAFIILGLIIFACTTVLTVIGGAFLIIAKVALAILAGLGPLFILAMLFQPTARFFELWLAQICNYGLLIVLLSPLFGFVMDMFINYTSELTIDGVNNMAYAFGGAAILAGVSVLLLLQLPNMAGGLAGGAGLSYLFELGAMRRMVGSRAMRGANGQVTRRGTGAVGAAGSAARGTAAGAAKGYGAAKTAATKAAGYFKKAA